MNIHRVVIVFALSAFIAGCYLPISGRVLDAETQQPIEGAVVLVEWTKTHGFGEYWTESYKVVETLSDKDGVVKIAGCYSPFVNVPDVTVYKEGYVAWNNKAIYPEYIKRSDFKWANGFSAKLIPFDGKRYNHADHVLFIHGSIHYGLPGHSKELIENAIRGEELKSMEDKLKRK